MLALMTGSPDKELNSHQPDELVGTDEHETGGRNEDHALFIADQGPFVQFGDSVVPYVLLPTSPYAISAADVSNDD